jgi:hypothetical protein
MCHQSVGLIQNQIEMRGIATISLTLKPEITFGVRVPRAAYIRFPLGYPLGEPHRPDLQDRILADLLETIIRTPGPPPNPDECGPIVRLPYRWRID